MKYFQSPRLPLAAFALSALALIAAAGAQEPSTTTATVTTTIPGQATPAQATIQMQTSQPTPTVAPLPGQHVAEIELVVSKGSIQAYFGRAARGEKLQFGSAELSVKLPSSATVTKLASRDGDSAGSRKVTPDNPWRVSVPFDGAGRYVFNISDWDDDPVVVSAVVKVDGVVLFSGRGSEDDLNGWAQKSYGPGVRKTGSREIAFILAAE